MSNSEKITDFMVKCGYPCSGNSEYHFLRKKGKKEKRIPYDMDYKEAVKEIVKYFED